MNKQIFFTIFFILLTVTIVNAEKDSLSNLSSAKSFTLYSIDGNWYDSENKPKTDETFHDYPVLGRTEIKDSKEREAIVAALQKSLDESNGEKAKCFRPRHGISVKNKEQTTDYVICFECFAMEVHNADSKEVKTITNSPRSVFNEFMKKNNIPLAPTGP